MSLIPSIVFLGLVALAAFLLTVLRRSPETLVNERVAASCALALAAVIQCVHFAEELLTRFHIRFPALFGLEPMPLWFFVIFNVAWIAVWIAAVPLIRTSAKPAVFAAWFLALAGMLNGVAHPMMAAASLGYFPGLISSPFIGLAGVVLYRRLCSATSVTPPGSSNSKRTRE